MNEPKAGEYWQHKVHTKDRAYFIGRTPDGEMVWQCEGDTIESGNLDWSSWQHLPGCTGWDWMPEVVVDPGDGWELLPKGTVLQQGDQVLLSDRSPNVWAETCYQGERVGSREGLENVYRRKIELVKSPKRVPVRLYWYDGNIVGRYDHSQPTDPSFYEIKSDGNGGWYVEVQP